MGENGLLKQLTKALLERAMQAELTEHLGYEKYDAAGHNSGNSRNGGTTKTLKGVAAGGAARSQRQLRIEDHRQEPDVVHRVRRQNHLHVRAGG